MRYDGTICARRAGAANGRARSRGRSRGSSAGRSSAGEQPRVSLYAEVTARIIAELEAGRFPWVQPWSSATAAPGLPCNAVTGRRYSGINILLLWGAVIERGHASQGWLTFAQALDAGGSVRKGERGVTVVYADRFTPENERERARSDDDDPRTISFLKRITLFNIDQCDGLPERLAVAAPPLPERETMPVAEALIVATGTDFRIGGAKAFYAPGADYVQVPPQPTFLHQIDYYRTALHELGHNAATRIMPHDLVLRLVFRASVVRRFGIIRALPRTRGAGHLAGSGLTVWAERRRERGPFPLSAYRRGCRSGWSRHFRDQARARSPLDRRRGAAGPSRCCGAAYAV